MFVQKLREYALRNLSDALADPAFEPQPVKWLLRIKEDGTFLGPPVDLTTAKNKKGKQYPDFPKTGTRSGGSVAALAADDLAYVFGPGNWTKEQDRQKHQRHHRAFVALLEEAAKITHDSGLKACAAFYRKPGEVEKAKQEMEKENLRSGRVAFTLASDDGIPVFQRPEVKKFWRKRFSEMGCRGRPFTGRESGGTECLCCGKAGSVKVIHDKIKNVPEGQGAGCSLISFDKDAFRSYGWEKSYNSPTCSDCAEAYVRALNRLMDKSNVAPRTRLDLGNVAFIFWTRQPETALDPVAWLQEADPTAVEDLLLAAYRGKQEQAGADENAFYAAALSGSGGRIVVREWIESTAREVKRNLSGWFRDLSVVTVWDQKDGDGRVVRRAGERSRPPRLFLLCAATGLKAERGSDFSPHVPPALVRAAVKGGPIPPYVLEACLRRVRLSKDGGVDAKFKPERMALVKICLNRSRNVEEGEPVMSESLDETCDDAGYVCGRLLSVLAYVQAYAQDKRQHRYGEGAQIVERFYGSASTAPRSVFPILLRLNRHHLRKAADENPGFSANREKEIESLICLLGKSGADGPDFPALLDLKGQGRFALGFYHQRAEFRKSSVGRPALQPAAV